MIELRFDSDSLPTPSPVFTGLYSVKCGLFLPFDALQFRKEAISQRAKCMFSEGLHWFTPERTQSKHPLNVRITFIVSLN